jgi:hypothetical protein
VLKLACERVDVARQLSRKLAPLLETEQLAAVNRDFELPLVDVLADIERAGIRVGHRGAGAAGRAARKPAAGAHRADPRAGRRRVQHQLAESSSARCCSIA